MIWLNAAIHAKHGLVKFGTMIEQPKQWIIDP